MRTSRSPTSRRVTADRWWCANPLDGQDHTAGPLAQREVVRDEVEKASGACEGYWVQRTLGRRDRCPHDSDGVPRPSSARPPTAGRESENMWDVWSQCTGRRLCLLRGSPAEPAQSLPP